MTKPLAIPAEPEHYIDADFDTATNRVHAARAKLLENTRVREVHDALVTNIAARVEERKASLAQVRKAVGLTQAQIASTLGIEQAEISKIERRANLQLATLERFIEATGGRLRISVIYGNVEVPLRLGDIAPSPPATAEAAAPAPSRRNKSSAATRKIAAAGRKGTTGKAATKDATTGRFARSAASKSTEGRAPSDRPQHAAKA